MIVVITGSRSLTGPATVIAALDQSGIDWDSVTELVHGGAPGVDQIAGWWAARRGIRVKVMRPNYTKYPPKRAPLVRNIAMCDYAKAEATKRREPALVLALWDGVSTGTQHCLARGRERGLGHLQITLPADPQPVGPPVTL